MHLAQLRPDGSLAGVPEGAHLVLEIGANTRNTLDRELLPQRPDAFLITFEPLLDKYAALLARNSRPDTRATLGAHHPRGLVLPFAVSGEHNGVRAFKISGRTDGCASLLDPVSSYYSQARSHLLTTHLLRSASDPRFRVRMQVGQADSSPTPSPNP